MELDDFAGDGEAQSPRRWGRRWWEMREEFLEDAVLEFGGDSGASVGDGKFQRVVGMLGSDGNRDGVGWGIFDGIGEEIRQGRREMRVRIGVEGYFDRAFGAEGWYGVRWRRIRRWRWCGR